MPSHKICEHCYGRLASLLPVKPGKIPARVKCPQVNMIDDCINDDIENRYDMDIAWKSYDESQMITDVKVHATERLLEVMRSHFRETVITPAPLFEI